MTKNNKFYITTPIYYTNGSPHAGSAYTTIAADVLSRWNKLLGKDVFFLTGTDEHGQKIQEAADKAGLKPKEFVDKIAKEFKDSFKLLNISYDHFIRTTDKYHESEVKKVLQLLYDKGFIYKGSYESYYCVGCEQYLTESDLVDGKCSLHNREPELRNEEAYLFKLSSFQDKLLKLIKSGEYSIMPEIRRKEIINFLESGLQDISISRLKERVSWGIELPFDKKHTTFVWVDAFWNYVSGLGDKKNFDKFWSPDVQLMAKDIVRVHATIWPALLLAAGYDLPKCLFVHGYFTINGKKMSKTLGNVISPDYLVGKYGSDSVRYYLMRNIPFGSDGDVSESGLASRHNSELADKFGNLVSRVSALAEKYGLEGVKLPVLSFGELEKIKKLFDNYELDKILAEIFSYIDKCNEFVQSNKPWESHDKRVLYDLVSAIRNITILLSPFMPTSCDKVAKHFGFKIDLKEINKPFKIKPIKKIDVLFNKVEFKEEKREIKEDSTISSIKISSDLANKGVKVHAALFSDIKISNKNSKLEEMKKESISNITKIDTNKNKNLIGYKELYNSKGFIPAPESLVNLVKKSGALPNINTVVDSYNLVSSKLLISMGAHDTSKMSGGLSFSITKGDEKFKALGDKDYSKIEANEYAFMDNEKVLCRFDVKQCDETKITKDTKEFVLYAQGNKETSDESVKEAFMNACNLIKSICGGNYKIINVVKDKNDKKKDDDRLINNNTGIVSMSDLKFSDWEKVDLKVGKVVSCEDVDGSDKLLKLSVDFGEGKHRVVMSGIKKFYSVKELKGKKFVFLCNLEPRKIMSVMSEAMILASHSKDSKGEEKLSLFVPDKDAEVGSKLG